MVDHILEIPLPGRQLATQYAQATFAKRAVVPVFVAGPENRLVAATFHALMTDADKRKDAADSNEECGNIVPPLISLFGPSGTGKTHLSQGLVNYWQQCRGEESAEYITAADFRRQVVEAISQRSISQWRGRFRSRELLVIDDLHQLPPEKQVLHELRCTIDAYEEIRGVVLVTANRPIAALNNLTPDLHSRFAGGLGLQLGTPGEATRARIIRHVSDALEYSVSDDAVERLAHGLRGSANQLIGALFELYVSVPRGCAANSDPTERLLAERAQRQPTLPEITASVAKYYRVPQRELKSGSRKQSIVAARAMVAFLARDLTAASYEQIGRALGGRDHTTVMHSFKKIDLERQHDVATQQVIDDLRRVLLNR